MSAEYGKRECRKVEGSRLLQLQLQLKKVSRARSIRVLGTVSSGASDDRGGRTGTAVWIRSLRYAGVEDDDTLNVSDDIL